MRDCGREILADAGLGQRHVYDMHTHGRDFEVREGVWVYCPTRKKRTVT